MKIKNFTEESRKSRVVLLEWEMIILEELNRKEQKRDEKNGVKNS